MIYETRNIHINNQTASLTSYIISNTPEVDEQRKRPAVVICPGGGYEFTSDREAEPIALKMMNMGFHAFVLNYSVKPNVYPQALLELATAVQIVRENHQEWGIDQDKIIIAGFSAGGHLAASLGVFWQSSYLLEKMKGDKESWQPNGLLLAYPVISSGEFGHEGSFKALLAENYEQMKVEMSLENQVNAMTPPTFLWHTLEDGLVPMENSLLFASQLRKQKIPFELHLFPNGGHGLSLATVATSREAHGVNEQVAVWPELFERWVKNNI
ncbi:alpha/beta hydrolase [Enterococcus sp.]|uniref:alpha/beta hydrolase n=1 Tax=Enterococcus sp. TaxID=35783 RepID=UPI002FCB95A3